MISCPKASHVQHLDKYNSELICKALGQAVASLASPALFLQHTPWGKLGDDDLRNLFQPNGFCDFMPSTNRVSVPPNGRTHPEPNWPWQLTESTQSHAQSHPLGTHTAARLWQHRSQAFPSPLVTCRSRCSPKVQSQFNPLCAGLRRWCQVPAEPVQDQAMSHWEGII